MTRAGKGTGTFTGSRIVEGDVLDYNRLKEALAGQDVVYANLAGDLEAMATNIVRAMDETPVGVSGTTQRVQ